MLVDLEWETSSNTLDSSPEYYETQEECCDFRVVAQDRGSFAIPDDADHAWAVWVRYSTWWTFGTTSGHCDCIAIFSTEEDAKALHDLISDYDRDKIGSFLRYKDVDYYVPGLGGGWGEGLQDVEYDRFEIT